MNDEEIRGAIQKAISEEHVMLFMKGTPDAPACGFSARTVQMLGTLGVEYSALDILPDPRIRQQLSDVSGWPTIPQLFVKGELVGGCDIATEMFESGELAELLEVSQPEAAPLQPSIEQAPIQLGDA
jgi:monothiol glutaredoxin